MIYLILNEQNVLVCRDGLFFLLIQEIQTSQIKNAFDSILDFCITNHHSRFIVKKSEKRDCENLTRWKQSEKFILRMRGMSLILKDHPAIVY